VLSWSKLFALSGREKRLLVVSVVALPVNAVALSLFGLNRWQALLSRLAPIDQPAGKADWESLLDQAHETARVVCIASSRGPYRGNCLQRSLTIWWLLRRQKIEGNIRFGARKEGGRFEAHAWVEFRDKALFDPSDVYPTFKPFERSVAHAKAKTL
jgi:hypothetical protein